MTLANAHMCKYRSILESELLILLLGQLFVGLYVDQWAKGQNGISNLLSPVAKDGTKKFARVVHSIADPELRKNVCHSMQRVGASQHADTPLAILTENTTDYRLRGNHGENVRGSVFLEHLAREF